MPTASESALRLTQRPRLHSVVLIALALTAATSVTGCGGGSVTSGKPVPSAATTSSTEPPRLGTGELIAFERVVPGTEDRALYVVGSDGGQPRLLRSAGAYPHWSPDGGMLAFSACLDPPACTTSVALLDRSTGDVHGLSSPDPGLEMHCGFAWSPDGKRLPCETYGVTDPKRNGIYTIRASDGKELTRITTNAGGEDFPLAYSPDGSQLLLSRKDPSRGASDGGALFVTPKGGGQPRRITPWGYADDSASWSADGRTIVFGTSGSLYRVSPEGQGLAKILITMPTGAPATSAFDVALAPTAGRIIFSVSQPEPGLYTALLDGSDVKRLTTSPTEDHHSNWSAPAGS